MLFKGTSLPVWYLAQASSTLSINTLSLNLSLIPIID